MRGAGLQARRKRRQLPFDLGVRAEHAIAPNVLDRQFEATAPNQRWVADFTYIWTEEGWLFFAVVLDLFLRRIVGWSRSREMQHEPLGRCLGQRGDGELLLEPEARTLSSQGVSNSR
jgi:transposase InsO family protein